MPRKTLHIEFGFLSPHSSFGSDFPHRKALIFLLGAREEA
jgi:hypothetical protein